MGMQEIGRVPAAVFDPEATFGCGQCFRWEKREGAWRGVAFGRARSVRARGGEILFEREGAAPGEFEAVWAPYFDLGRDYDSVRNALSGDAALRRAVAFAPGLRILRQEPWEALCSFLFSQNNNIPRIRGIVERLCREFGEPLPGGEYAFPTPGRLAALSPEALAPLRSGYRAGYVLDAAQKVASGALNLDALRTLPLDEARARLMLVRGVGPKVADCALLFGCGRLDAFPVDVWVRRVLARWYPRGFPEELRPLGGIAQQFLFHYARCAGLDFGCEPDGGCEQDGGCEPEAGAKRGKQTA